MLEEEFPGMWEQADLTGGETDQDDDWVELTIRVPEQFFTQKFPKRDWESSLYATLTDVPGFGVEYLTGGWRSDLDVEQELYGPDGLQVPLW